MRHIHGGDIFTYQAAYQRIPLDFSTNVNPFGMPPSVREAAVTAVDMASSYPDPQSRALRMAIAQHEGVPAEQILCANGAADLIYRFAFAVRPQSALVCAPTFAEYGQALTAAGCTVKTHMLAESDGFALTRTVLSALQDIDALCLCNPNNPTGLTIAPDLLHEILEVCKSRKIAVLLDECFVDFLDEPERHTQIARISSYPGLVVLKAFTKLYAMPGLRLGYALCADPGLLCRMDAAGAPWSVSTVAQAAGIAALSQRVYVEESRALIQAERAFLRQMLGSMRLEAIGEANFLLFKAPGGLSEALREEGILVRDCANFAGLGPGWIRIAIRTRAENMQLISRLGRIIHG